MYQLSKGGADLPLLTKYVPASTDLSGYKTKHRFERFLYRHFFDYFAHSKHNILREVCIMTDVSRNQTVWDEVHNIIVDNRYSLREVFTKFDKAGSGLVSKSEFTAGMIKMVPHLRLTVDEIGDLFREVDTDHTYKINYPQFVEVFRPKKSKLTALNQDEVVSSMLSAMNDSKDSLQAVFKSFDITESNYVSKTEMRLGLNRLGLGGPLGVSDADMNALMNSLDITGDGRLNYTEFVKKRSKPRLKRKDVHQPPTQDAAVIDAVEHIRQVIKLHGYTLRDVFDAFDTTGTGNLSKREFIAGLARLCPELALKPDTADRLFRFMDHANTYSVSFANFVARLRLEVDPNSDLVVTTKKMREFINPHIRELRENMLTSFPTLEEVFAFFDNAENNYITKKELRLGLLKLKLGGPLGPSKLTVLALMNALDQTGDGRVNKKEFFARFGKKVDFE